MSMASRLLARIAHLPPALTRDVGIERDLPVTMPDGAVLLADRYFPRGVGTPPVVLIRTPYGRRSFGVFGRVFAERGYQTVIQSLRGTFGSGGHFEFRDEGDDGRATLDWLARQGWFGGRVGMYGPSYLGFVQWAVAAKAPRPSPGARHPSRDLEPPRLAVSGRSVPSRFRADADSHARHSGAAPVARPAGEAPRTQGVGACLCAPASVRGGTAGRWATGPALPGLARAHRAGRSLLAGDGSQPAPGRGVGGRQPGRALARLLSPETARGFPGAPTRRAQPAADDRSLGARGPESNGCGAPRVARLVRRASPRRSLATASAAGPRLRDGRETMARSPGLAAAIDADPVPPAARRRSRHRSAPRVASRPLRLRSDRSHAGRRRRRDRPARRGEGQSPARGAAGRARLHGRAAPSATSS